MVPIGEITFGFYRITYASGDVNSKTYPWVNFDDDLDPEVYPQLYALYGDSLSSGAAEGMFNLSKLADRFPLVSASNLGSTGGEKTHTLKKAELPANLTGYITMHSANTGTNVQTAGGVFSKGTNLPQFRAGGDLVEGASSTGQINFNLGGISQAFSIIPPWISACVHVRSG